MTFLPSPLEPTDNEFALIARVFAGEASDADRAQLDRWRKTDPERDLLLERLHGVWERTGAVAAGDIEKELLQIHRRIARRRQRVTPRRWPQSHVRDFAWAASLLLAVGITGYVAYGRFAARTPHAAAIATLPLTEVATVRGQR